ncbi:type IV secretory system conjugative DNA transfer family protein [Amycolatopsis sp. OK19-0408]|uniref:Type IV secretory system conjugative DNA transfer family protein n=1 Tax=Amycolatopsis iheyensis TaxID=2945988 RepID=A0A9X2NC74_9PSEU|nr:type IV secretory system conjugative DNA transfer family protein [Amycolatopsis iheyensis]MCR6484039.1 type IV secretory system conjugative DNA transfer family protein [Amycolatopsis iheyensis]
MAPDATSLVFSQLHLPRPLESTAVIRFLERLASDRDEPRVIFEARASETGTQHLLGCRAGDVHPFRRLLGDLLPGTILAGFSAASPNPRPTVDVARQLRLHSASLPLRTDVAEPTTLALLSALAVRLHTGESLVMQIILGPRHIPRSVHADVPDPDSTMLDALTAGARPASSETRQRLKDRLSRSGFRATIRLGAASSDSDRRRRFVTGLLSAISTARSPGVQMTLAPEKPKALDGARLPWRWPLHLAVPELLGLLAWPIGDGELPGLPPLHPKPLRAAPGVHTGPRVFAQSAAPGDERQIGISAQDQTFHGIAYGPSGSGKTTAIEHLILADIEAGRAVAVLDPKRQLIDNLMARIPEGRIDDVVEINAGDQAPVGFNPLDIGDRDPDVVVDGILAVFASVFSDGWGPRTQDIFSACLRTLARASTPEEPATLVDLTRLLTDPAFRRRQVGRIQNDVALAGFWAWYEGQSPQAQAAAIAPPLNKLRQFLLRPALIRMLDQRSGRFRLRDLFRENKIVLAPLNEGLVGPGTASLLGSLIVADIWQATQERAGDPGAGTTPATIYIDEAPRFLNLPVSMADALAVSRSLGVGWFLAAQFRSQFPPALARAVDMNARSKIQFATEYEDARDTAKLTRDLTPEDFMALPQFHAYANLVADGHPSGWALVRTLPPTVATIDPAIVRAASQANYAPIEDAAPTTTSEPDAEPEVAPELELAPQPIERIGRKRRTS